MANDLRFRSGYDFQIEWIFRRLVNETHLRTSAYSVYRRYDRLKNTLIPQSRVWTVS